MLFGDECEILSEKCDFWEIETDYGYRGFVKKESLCPKSFKSNYIVSVPFADVLFQDSNGKKPFLSLPFGAKLSAEEYAQNPKYFRLKGYKTPLFIHKNHIKPISFPKKQEEFRYSVARTAIAYIGVQYRWGGRTPLGIDCSGLCFNAYRQNGINIWRDADMEKSENLYPIPFNKAEIGDLMFFKGHMAMYLGEGRIIHASSEKGCVLIEKYENNKYLKENYISTGTIFK